MNALKGNILTNNNRFRYASVEHESGTIQSVSYLSETEDKAAPYILPGFTDIHSHGCIGHDTCDASVEGLLKMAEYELSQGVTSYFPTTMTLDEERLTAAVEAVVKASEQAKNIKGIYLEGPFISPERLGAQNPDYVKAPDFEMLLRLQKHAKGMIKFVAIAPEVPGAEEFIRRVKESEDPAIKGISLSIAHTNADYYTARSAIKAGAGQATHLYNAMTPFNHRDPGVVGAVFDSDAVAELIADGIHVHQAVIRTTFKLLGADRICLISDSCEAAGMPDGDYELGGQAVHKKGRLAVLDNGTTIAGSASTLLDCFRFTVQKAGVPIEEAIVAASLTPAGKAGIDPSGILVFDRDLQLIQILDR